MFYKLSKIFIYASALTPVLLIKPLFFPFITGKAIGFRVCVELALLFFALHLLAEINNPTFYKQLLGKLKHPIVLCVALFAGMITITALTSGNPTQAFWSNFERGEGAFQMLHYAVFFILTVLLFSDRKSLDRLLIFNVATSLPISLYALLQLVSTNPLVIAPGPRVSGTLGNPSYLAAYLIFILAFILYFLVTRREYITGFVTYLLSVPAGTALVLYLTSREWGANVPAIANQELDSLFMKGAFWYVGIAVVLYLLSLANRKLFQTVTLASVGVFELFILLKTGTRGAFLALVAGILVFAVLNFLITRNKKLQLTLGSIFAGGLFLVMLFFATPHAGVWQKIPVFGRLINLGSAMNDIRPRIWTWGSGLSGFIERPVAGWGAENFPVPFDKYYNPNHYGIESFFDRTHNIFLEYAITGGLLVLLPWLAIFWFYYKRLNKRPKDIWYTILFVIPIMHLVQGFFLFDTLPIYIGFFFFLAMAINTEPETTPLAARETAWPNGANIATSGALAVGCIALLYYTAYLPLQKNLLIVKALKTQNSLGDTRAPINPGQVVEAFHLAMTTYSPIGLEESIGMHQKFILSLIEQASQNQKATADPQVRAEVRALTLDANKWYDENIGIYPGLKAQYINGGINLRAGVSFNQADLLKRGKDMFTDALTQAPTRLEFMRVLIELARMEGDTDSLKLWGRRAHLYRPDLFTLEELAS